MAGWLAEWVEVLAPKANNLSLLSGIHVVGEKKLIASIVL